MANKPDYHIRPEPPAANGWTQYQKLVLAELERHEESLNKLYDEMTLLKLGQRTISSDIVKFAEQSQKGLETLKETIDKEASALKEARAELSKAKDELINHRITLSGINFKIGALITCVSMVASAAVSALFKFFFLH